MSIFFPFQRLPSLALGQVVKHLEIIEIFNLIKCSRKTHILLKRWTKQTVVATHLEILSAPKFEDPDQHGESHIYLLLNNVFFILNLTVPSNSTEPEIAHKWKFGRCALSIPAPTISQDLEWTSSVKDSVACITTLDFLIESFNLKWIAIINEHADSRESYKVLEHAINLGLKIERVTWSVINFDDEGGRSPPEILRNLSTNELELRRADWVTLEHICTLTNIPIIRFGRLVLSDQELNKIVKKWISGALNFDHITLVLGRYNVNAERVMDGTNAEVIRWNLYYAADFVIEKADGTSKAVGTVCSDFLGLRRL